MGVDLLTGVFGEGGAKQSALLRKDFGISAISEIRQEARGALNVGEQKGDCSGWQISHARFTRSRQKTRWNQHFDGKPLELLLW